jgi:hypothetical protein
LSQVVPVFLSSMQESLACSSTLIDTAFYFSEACSELSIDSDSLSFSFCLWSAGWGREYAGRSAAQWAGGRDPRTCSRSAGRRRRECRGREGRPAGSGGSLLWGRWAGRAHRNSYTTPFSTSFNIIPPFQTPKHFASHNTPEKHIRTCKLSQHQSRTLLPCPLSPPALSEWKLRHKTY